MLRLSVGCFSIPLVVPTLTVSSQLTPLPPQMFPRHVIEHMVRSGASPAPDGSDNQLASFHEGVSVMFMDIVGFTAMSKDVQAGQVRQGEKREGGGRGCSQGSIYVQGERFLLPLIHT